MSPHRVFVRRVYSRDGECTSENEVFCLRRERTLAVAECECCDAYDGAVIDLERHRNYVACAGATIESTRALGPSRRPLLIRRPGSGSSSACRATVAEAMMADVVCAREDLRVAVLGRILVERGFGAAPVVDSHGRAIGMVTAHDLLLANPDARVRELMTALVFSLPDNATIAEAAALMALERIHHVPIVTDDGKVCGIVSTLDLLGWIARSEGYVVAG